MQRFEEMFGPQRGAQVFHHPIINQDGAQKGGFRLDIGGQCAGLRALFGADQKVFIGHGR